MNKIDIDNVELDNVELDGNEILEESYDSDREADISSEKKEECERIHAKQRIRESFIEPRQSNLGLNFARGSIKKSARNSTNYTRQISRLSVYD